MCSQSEQETNLDIYKFLICFYEIQSRQFYFANLVIICNVVWFRVDFCLLLGINMVVGVNMRTYK